MAYADIDILVVLKDKEVDSIKELKESIDIIADLSLEFDEVISCIFMSDERYLREKSPLLFNIRRDGVIL